LEGTVVLQFIVTAEGTAVDFKVTASLGLGLDEAAIAAVQQWRFQPGLRAGNPVPVASTAQLNFKLVSNKTGWEMLRAAFDMPQGVERPHVTRSEFPHGKPAGHGTVALTFMIDERGEPKDLSVDKSDSKLEQEIIAAVKKWRFKPATKNGTPIAVQATFEFNALRVF
jgi:TonB family protein